MQKIDLAELRRLWEETTPGEWALAWEDGKTGVLASMIGKLVAFIGNPDPSDGYEPTRKANGEFIAAAHNALPALLDELEAAREELREVQNGAALQARDRRMKLIGAAEELERIAQDREVGGGVPQASSAVVRLRTNRGPERYDDHEGFYRGD
jgi:hypothetical protein